MSAASGKRRVSSPVLGVIAGMRLARPLESLAGGPSPGPLMSRVGDFGRMRDLVGAVIVVTAACGVAPKFA